MTTRCFDSSANSLATACLNCRPCGESSTTRVPSGYAPDALVPSKFSIAAKIGSGFITIPSPPPNGRSSTILCLSVAYSRMSWTFISTIPASFARRIIPKSKTASKNSGKIVNTSIFMTGPHAPRVLTTQSTFNGVQARAPAFQSKIQESFWRIDDDLLLVDVHLSADALCEWDQVLLI